ncbi:MAG: hypothetical protein RL172_729 [Bacteroidota bacterium]
MGTYFFYETLPGTTRPWQLGAATLANHFSKQPAQLPRVQQTEWDAPDCSQWIAAIDAAVGQYPAGTVVLLAHSLACTAVAHWAKKYNRPIKGALLVAPSDIETPAYTFPSTGFTPIPLEPLPFKTIVVTSDNDVWVSAQRAHYFASCWGSQFVNIGDAGHINADAGFGPWPQGMALIQQF